MSSPPFFRRTRDDYFGLNPRVPTSSRLLTINRLKMEKLADAQISCKIEDFEKFGERRCEIMKKMKKGFTLIELLIVIAIIGILAGVILVSTSSARDKARRTSAMESVRSVMPFLTECNMSGNTITAAPNNLVAVSTACTSGGTTINYPMLNNGSTSGCNYNGSSATVVNVNCTSGGFSCDIVNAKCN